MEAAIERQTMKKVYLRLLPFCFVLYFICYLDRVNIGFAALTMNKDIGLSAYVFGLGAGAFFWGYFLLEVPSNLALERFGYDVSDKRAAVVAFQRRFRPELISAARRGRRPPTGAALLPNSYHTLQASFRTMGASALQ